MSSQAADFDFLKPGDLGTYCVDNYGSICFIKPEAVFRMKSGKYTVAADFEPVWIPGSTVNGLLSEVIEPNYRLTYCPSLNLYTRWVYIRKI